MLAGKMYRELTFQIVAEEKVQHSGTNMGGIPVG